MSSIFSIFGIGVSGLMANQTSLHVTGQNIANANTDNYVRQRAELREAQPVDAAPGQLGSGVKVEEIIRIKDEFTDFQIRKENQTMGYLEEKNNILQQLENIYNEPSENGLNALINSFYDSLQDLSNQPEDFSARIMVREQGLALTDSFNSTMDKISQLQDNLNENVRYKVEQINSITGEIASLNDQIGRAEVGDIQKANDLRNRRDTLVRELSKIGDVFVRENDNNLLDVQLGDQILVSGIHQIKVGAVNNDNNMLKLVTENQQDVTLRNGSMYALFECRDEIIESYADNLDTLARSFIEQMNDVHIGGVGLTLFQGITSENSVSGSGVPLANAGLDFNISGGQFTISLYDSYGSLKSENVISINPFSDTLEDVADAINAVSGLTASVTSDKRLSIGVSTPSDRFSFVSDSSATKDNSNFLSAIGLNTFFKGHDARTITVADSIINDVNKITAGKTPSPGDNSNVLAMINTREQELVNGAKFEDFFASVVGDLGVERQVAMKREDTQKIILQSLDERQQAQSGVSFDEEAVNLVKFQRGYQAASKFIQVIDGLIGTLIDMV